jgi:hypothetical protein
MVALVAGSFVAFAEVLDRPGRRGAWVAYVVLTALAVYASYVAILALPAQLLVLFWRRSAWRPVMTALAVCAVAWIPLAVLAARRGGGQLFWIPHPGLTVEKQVILALTSAGFEPNFRLATGAPVLAVGTVILLAVGAARAPRQRSALLVLCWLVVPVVLMWLESLVGQPLFTARNVLLSLPAVALLLGWVTTRSRLGWVALAVLIALRAAALGPSYGTSPENWRAATAYVRSAAQPGDCYAFYPLDGRMPFAYYSDAPVRPYVERYEVPQVPAGCARVWLIASHQGLPRGTAASRLHYRRYLTVRRTLAQSYPRATTRSFGYASVIWVQLYSR